MKKFDCPSELSSSVGQELGPSPWVLVEQERIDTFARATGDFQWIHTDQERAATGPYGTTIAHGYLTLAMLPALNAETFSCPFAASTVNYGLNRVRFLTPVVSGAEVRTTPTILDVEDVSSGLRVILRHNVESRRHRDAPIELAAAIETVTLYVVENKEDQ